MVRFSDETAASSKKQRLLWYSGTSIALCLVSLLAYGASLRMPFVQDDWHVLYAIKTTPAATFLADAFWPFGKLFYRPLGSTYFLLLYKLFGLDPLPFHIIALALHTLNAFLVVLIVGRLTGRIPIAAATGILYVAAATVQADPLLWMVGFFDLGALCLFFSAFLFYLSDLTAVSAAAFLFSLLVKESAAPLIAVFLLHALLLDRKRLRSLWPHLLIFILYSSIRLLAWTVLPPDPAQTYEMFFSKTALLNNISLLLRWSFEVLFPWWTADPRVVGVVVAGTALIAFVALLRSRARDRGKMVLGVFLLGWLIAGLIPVVFLRHQLFRYYAACSFVPFVLLVLLFGREFLTSLLRLPKVLAASTLAVFVLANVGANVILQNERFQKERAPGVRIYDGTNHMIRKCAIVRSAQSDILGRYPSVQPGAMIVLGGIDTAPFAGNLGLRLWYNDTTIDVCTVGEYDSLLLTQPEQHRQVLVFTFRGDTLNQRQ